MKAPGKYEVTNSLQRYSIDHPLSSFSETLRAAKVAVDLALGDRKPKIIGVISALPNEGKSTVAKNFASLLAHLGARTVLIDADLRNPDLTRGIAGNAEAGILEAIRGDRTVRDLLLWEPESGLFVLPAVDHEARAALERSPCPRPACAMCRTRPARFSTTSLSICRRSAASWMCARPPRCSTRFYCGRMGAHASGDGPKHPGLGPGAVRKKRWRSFQQGQHEKNQAI